MTQIVWVQKFKSLIQLNLPLLHWSPDLLDGVGRCSIAFLSEINEININVESMHSNSLLRLHRMNKTHAKRGLSNCRNSAVTQL